MRVSWAFECSPGYGLSGDRTPEKRKVGGSTPPLTTTTDLQKTVLHLRKRGEAPSLLSGWLRLFTADGGWLRPIRAHVAWRHRRRCPAWPGVGDLGRRDPLRSAAALPN